MEIEVVFRSGGKGRTTDGKKKNTSSKKSQKPLVEAWLIANVVLLLQPLFAKFTIFFYN